jgi:hypothetical protein
MRGVERGISSENEYRPKKINIPVKINKDDNYGLLPALSPRLSYYHVSFLFYFAFGYYELFDTSNLSRAGDILQAARNSCQ